MGWKYDDKQVDKMVRLHDQEGLSYRTIGKRFGTDAGHTRTLVRNRRSLLGIAGSSDSPGTRRRRNNKGTDTTTQGET